MSEDINNENEEEEERKIPEALAKKYMQRITYAKQGQEASARGDFLNAIKFYHMYLKTICEWYNTTEEVLSPSTFDLKKDTSELLLVSHIYWDLCKIYDLTPNLNTHFQQSINKFVKFSKGMPFQIVNSEMLRKFIRKDHHRHKEEFNNAYAVIKINAKKCFVATYLYGEYHPVTNQLRSFRDNTLSQYRIGLLFMDFYNSVSPKLIQMIEHNIFLRTLFIFLVKPIVFLCHRLILIFNSKK